MSSLTVSRFPGVSDLLLERYLCGELPPEESRRVEDAARASPALAAHLRERHAEREAFLLRRPFGPVRARLESQRAPVRPGWTSLRALWPVLALGLMVVVAMPWLLRPDAGERVRVRGGLTARVLVKRGEVVFEQVPGVVLRPGDRVRVEVEDVEGGVLYLLALSDRGRTTPLYGFAWTGGAARMEPGRWVFPGSLELDAAPEREALVVVLASNAPEAPTPEAVVRWVEQAAQGSEFPPRLDSLPGTRHALRELPKDPP